MNSSDGDWRDFIKDFNNFEEKIFYSCINSNLIPWWHLVRYNIMYEILIKKNLSTPLETFKVKSSIKGKLKNIFNLLFEIFIIISLGNKKIQSLYFFTRKIEYIDKLISTEKKHALIISRDKKDYGKNIVISVRTISILAKLIKSFVVINKNLKEKMMETSEEIMTRYNTDVYKLMKNTYKTQIGFNYAWKIILVNLPYLNKIFFTSNDSNYSLVHLANKLKIESYEVQHGYMGSTNIMYSLPKLNEKLSTLPNKIIITDYTKDITYPVDKIFIKENLDNVDEQSLEKNIDILIGSDIAYFRETIEVSKALSKNKFNICVKLHPSQVDYKYFRKFIPSNIKIYSGDYDIRRILKKSKIFIPIFPMSSTIFIANKFKNIIIHYRLVNMKLSKIFDELINYKVDSVDDLVSKVEYLLNKDNNK